MNYKNIIIYAAGVLTGIVVHKIIVDREAAAYLEKSDTYSKDEALDSAIDDLNFFGVPRDNTEDDTQEMKTIISDQGYTPDKKECLAHVISPDELGEEPEYMTVELTLVPNGDIIDNASGEVIDDPESIVGNIDSFRTNDDEDCCYIRNDDLKTDYEILKQYIVPQN